MVEQVPLRAEFGVGASSFGFGVHVHDCGLYVHADRSKVAYVYRSVGHILEPASS